MAREPRALDPAEAMAKPQMTQEQIDAMVNKLAERMKANPDDPKGWLMLARSYKQMGRYAEAVDAFSHAEKVVNEEPDLLAAYAETIAMAEGKGLKGKPTQLVDKALKLDPKHGHSLFLAGAAAGAPAGQHGPVRRWRAVDR